jgi:hypothetical protein
MRALRLPRRMFVASLTLLAATGCASASSGGRPDLPRVGAPAGAAIRVALAPPRDLGVVRRGGDSAVVRGVRVVDGTLRDMRGDTALVVLTAAFGAVGGGPNLVEPGTTAMVVLDSAAAVTVLSRSPRALETGLAATIVVGAAFVALLVAAYRNLLLGP